MDAAQYRNWMDFTGRMARRVRPSLRPTRRARIASTATALVDALTKVHDHRSVVDWDAPPCPAAFFADGLARTGFAGPGGLDEDGTIALSCIQAGFDLAVSPSSEGVVGSEATLGLLRRMYPDGLPGFVLDHLESVGVSPEAHPDGHRVWL
jgi:hypothetical protein